MNTRKMTKELRQSHWAKIISDRAESGLSIKAYCEKEGIRENSYFYWRKKIREVVGGQMMELQTGTLYRGLEQSSFVEIKVPEIANIPSPHDKGSHYNGIAIEIKGARISAGSEYPIDKLAKLTRGLMRG